MNHPRMPVYRRIASTLWDEIHRGELAPGERLPSEPELAERFQVNRLTVRQAVTDLQRLGAVEIRRGRGTFVVSPPDLIEIVMTVRSLAQEHDTAMEGLANLRPTTPLRHVEETLVNSGPATGAGADLAVAELGLPARDMVRLDTCMIQDGEAWIVNSYFLPRRLRGIEAAIAEHGLFIEALRVGFGLDLEYRWRAFSAESCGFEDSRLLGVPLGSALLVRDGVTAEAGGDPLFYVRRRLRGERAKFVLRYEG